MFVYEIWNMKFSSEQLFEVVSFTVRRELFSMTVCIIYLKRDAHTHIEFFFCIKNQNQPKKIQLCWKLKELHANCFTNAEPKINNLFSAFQ